MEIILIVDDEKNYPLMKKNNLGESLMKKNHPPMKKKQLNLPEETIATYQKELCTHR